MPLKSQLVEPLVAGHIRVGVTKFTLLATQNFAARLPPKPCDMRAQLGMAFLIRNALSAFNCASYRLGIKETQAWIDEGRPR
jgi:hypothetical protein